ncbi:MAG: c-type cytochrome [Bryobacteraceae bacterium]
MLRRMSIFCALFATSILTAQDKPVIRKVSPSLTDPSSGKEMFIAYCATCHGRDAMGTGPAAPALKLTPADLTTLTMRNKGKFPELRVFNTIKGDSETPAHGSKDMPVWGAVFSQLAHGNQGEVQMRISNLVSYVRSIQKK